LISDQVWQLLRLVAVDVDGVLTDGCLLLVGNALGRSFNIRDGLAIKLLCQAGINTVIITGRSCSALEVRRWKDLGVAAVIQKARDKSDSLGKWLVRNGFRWQEVCYLGDDLPDLAAMKCSAVSACPADACAEVKTAATIVCRKRGGEGVLREMAELILNRKKKWLPLVRTYGC